MDIFLLNKKDIDSKTILHKNLSNMHIALHNMHIAHISILRPTYTLTGEAPICNGNLLQDFGYTATTPASRAVLDGTFVAPPNSDAATLDLFAEIAHIRRLVPAGSLNIVITPK